ncbi:MAG: TraR/DksA C4-type zinc finger protein [Acidimicrobiales bacterium]
MDADHTRERLAEERQRLQGIKDDFAEEHLTDETERERLGESSDNAQHQADTGTETFDRERDLSILAEVEAELHDIDHALKRLDEGTYGTCEACGKAIADERLEALPAARFCVKDQGAAEHEVRTHSGNS